MPPAMKKKKEAGNRCRSPTPRSATSGEIPSSRKDSAGKGQAVKRGLSPSADAGDGAHLRKAATTKKRGSLTVQAVGVSGATSSQPPLGNPCLSLPAASTDAQQSFAAVSPVPEPTRPTYFQSLVGSAKWDGNWAKVPQSQWPRYT